MGWTDSLIWIVNIALVALGFGFVIFWHELGHFLAAKWAGVRVEQFAVGFGNAIVAWRKGLGLRFGTTTPEYERISEAEPERAKSISPTEYRLNWVPLGGYVKMFGQEDMVASTTSPEPDHYMNKTVGQRMVIISAGVVMNVILAAILFTVLFFVGYHPPAAIIGGVVPGGPADRAGLEVGDRIVSIDGETQYAWTTVSIASALLKPGVPASFVVQPAGTNDPAHQRTVKVVPEHRAETMGMVGVGIERASALRGMDPRFVSSIEEGKLREMLSPDDFAILPGEEVTEVAGIAVGEGDYHVLHRALQSSGGAPVPIRVRRPDGGQETRHVMPRLYAVDDNAFAGLLPLLEVGSVQDTSPSLGKLLPGDVIERIVVTGTADTLLTPSLKAMKDLFKAAGERGGRVEITVRRNGEPVRLEGLQLIELPDEGYGLGFAPRAAPSGTTLAGVRPESPAGSARVPSWGRVTAVDGATVASWFEVSTRLKEAAARGAAAVTVAVEQPGGAVEQYELALDQAARDAILHVPVSASLFFVNNGANELKTMLKTRNPLQAIGWGVVETKNQIVQLYLTLKRVTVDRTVSPRNLTGPVGIFQFGTVVAQKGPDWIVWFLAVISANLAVVNFLPIPILDGGHMVFLASEKITGRPPSPRIQTAALYAGLVMIVGLVLFVTYNDIQRLLFL